MAPILHEQTLTVVTTSSDLITMAAQRLCDANIKILFSGYLLKRPILSLILGGLKRSRECNQSESDFLCLLSCYNPRDKTKPFIFFTSHNI